MNLNDLLRGLVILFSLMACQRGQQTPSEMVSKTPGIVIAHRGASGYLPEHTLAAKAMSYAMQPEFIEQDLVLSKDGVPVVIHDIYLESVSDVASKFPRRKREDGRYYVIDFTFEELKTLEISERLDPTTGLADYEGRFPLKKSSFKLHSLEQEIELIQGLNKSTGNAIGIYPEIKSPAFHRKNGQDISAIVLKILSDYGYNDRNDKCILQCFDAGELKRIRQELESELFLVQLTEIEEGKAELKEISTYADGIGPWYKEISPEFVRQAQDLGLKVHTYTFRADDLGDFKNFEELLSYGYDSLKVDGIFTDFPDKARNFLLKRARK